MKIFIAGATGAVGRPLIAELLDRGHTLVALTRSSDRGRALAQQGIEPAIADVFDAESVAAVIRRARPELVIEQLTALPQTYTRESMTAAGPLNRRLRLEGGDNVLAAAKAAGVRRYLRQSIAFWSAPGPGLADEQANLAINASSAVAADAHVVAELERRLLASSSSEPSIEGLILRYGFFYGPGTWFHPEGDVAGQIRRQEFPIVGNGDGVWSWLHIDDAARATAAAVQRGNPGIYHITGDHPLPVREWLPAFAEWLGAPPPPRVSIDEARQVAGEDAVYYGTQLRGASNAKAKRELGFQPRPLEWTAHEATAAQR